MAKSKKMSYVRLFLIWALAFSARLIVTDLPAERLERVSAPKPYLAYVQPH